MAAESIGIFNSMSLVNLLRISALFGKKLEWAGRKRTSSKVKASENNFGMMEPRLNLGGNITGIAEKGK
jgi:hypothetical protein